MLMGKAEYKSGGRGTRPEGRSSSHGCRVCTAHPFFPSYHHHLPLTPKVPGVPRLSPFPLPFPQTRTYRITDLTVDPVYPMDMKSYDEFARNYKRTHLERDRQPPLKPASPWGAAWDKITLPPPPPPPPPAAWGTAVPPPPPPPTQPRAPTTCFEANTNRFAALFPTLPSFADNLSVSDDPDDDASDAESYDEGVEAQLLAVAEELIHYNDELQEFATAQFAAHPNPCFKHPLQYALHLMELGLATLSSPPDEPIAKLRECGVQATPTPAPPHAECGVRTTPTPAPIPSPLPPVRKPRPASRPTKTPTARSPSPSTHATFDKVLAQLSALQKEVSPPPSPPPTSRAVSPVPRTENPHHSSITVAVPYGTTSLVVDRVDHPIYAWSFKIAASAPPAQVQRGRSPRRRPLAAFALRSTRVYDRDSATTPQAYADFSGYCWVENEVDWVSIGAFRPWYVRRMQEKIVASMAARQPPWELSVLHPVAPQPLCSGAGWQHPAHGTSLNPILLIRTVEHAGATSGLSGGPEESLDRKSPDIVEMHQEMTDAMSKIHHAIVQCMTTTLAELKRANTMLDLDDLSIDNTYFPSFDMVVRRILDPVWHQVAHGGCNLPSARAEEKRRAVRDDGRIKGACREGRGAKGGVLGALSLVLIGVISARFRRPIWVHVLREMACESTRRSTEPVGGPSSTQLQMENIFDTTYMHTDAENGGPEQSESNKKQKQDVTVTGSRVIIFLDSYKMCSSPLSDEAKIKGNGGELGEISSWEEAKDPDSRERVGGGEEQSATSRSHPGHRFAAPKISHSKGPILGRLGPTSVHPRHHRDLATGDITTFNAKAYKEEEAHLFGETSPEMLSLVLFSNWTPSQRSVSFAVPEATEVGKNPFDILPVPNEAPPGDPFGPLSALLDESRIDSLRAEPLMPESSRLSDDLFDMLSVPILPVPNDAAPDGSFAGPAPLLDSSSRNGLLAKVNRVDGARSDPFATLPPVNRSPASRPPTYPSPREMPPAFHASASGRADEDPFSAVPIVAGAGWAQANSANMSSGRSRPERTKGDPSASKMGRTLSEQVPGSNNSSAGNTSPQRTVGHTIRSLPPPAPFRTPSMHPPSPRNPEDPVETHRQEHSASGRQPAARSVPSMIQKGGATGNGDQTTGQTQMLIRSSSARTAQEFNTAISQGIWRPIDGEGSEASSDIMMLEPDAAGSGSSPGMNTPPDNDAQAYFFRIDDQLVLFAKNAQIAGAERASFLREELAALHRIVDATRTLRTNYDAWWSMSWAAYNQCLFEEAQSVSQ
ncbi:hypothetical protein LXA43DRAFT_1066448 [Ganoderma leucocontextum]|nr:hypothetical protein LXA43DRAFT_1066448 [Ganoderma leucocontextum]